MAFAWAAANALLGAVTLTVALQRLGEPLPDRVPPIRRLVAFGAKGLLGSNSPVEYYRLDQAVVGLFLTPVALGLYVAALAFTNLPRFISTSVGMVAYPHVASVKDPSEATRKLWRFFSITVAACLGWWSRSSSPPACSCRSSSATRSRTPRRWCGSSW